MATCNGSMEWQLEMATSKGNISETAIVFSRQSEPKRSFCYQRIGSISAKKRKKKRPLDSSYQGANFTTGHYHQRHNHNYHRSLMTPPCKRDILAMPCKKTLISIFLFFLFFSFLLFLFLQEKGRFLLPYKHTGSHLSLNCHACLAMFSRQRGRK